MFFYFHKISYDKYINYIDAKMADCVGHIVLIQGKPIDFLLLDPRNRTL